MLKFLFLGVVLMLFVNSWELVQVFMFFMCFIFMVKCGHDFYLYELGYMMGMDYLSYILILLSFWILGLMICSSEKVKQIGYFSSVFLMTNLLLMVALMLTFSSMNYLLFYVSFESSLIPTLILILGWGYQPERIQAGVYMLFYTLFASLPLLVCILVLYNKGGSVSMGVATGNVSSWGFHSVR